MCGKSGHTDERGGEGFGNDRDPATRYKHDGQELTYIELAAAYRAAWERSGFPPWITPAPAAGSARSEEGHR